MSTQAEVQKNQYNGLLDIVKIVLQALALAILVRIFLVQPFNIPSGSMKETLLVGDYLFVSKYSYGYSKYSIPGSFNLFSGRILAGKPKRGDVAVFRNPSELNIDYIKRVIGLPGDRIQMVNGQLIINDKPVPKTRVGSFYDEDNGRHIPIFEETLPEGIKYKVLDDNPDGDFDNTQVYLVPEGHYFMMGDNRDHSSDSRNQNNVGFVPFENFIGRAEFLFFSVDKNANLFQFWTWPMTTRWSRIFNGVR